MVCEQHERDKVAKVAKETGKEEQVASSMVQMEA
jgi:hypothetical protein